jgi:hypothetical protein
MKNSAHGGTVVKIKVGWMGIHISPIQKPWPREIKPGFLNVGKSGSG